MSEEKGWKTRPVCNIMPGCDKGSVIVMYGKFCCGDHLMKMVEMKRKRELEAAQELIKDADSNLS